MRQGIVNQIPGTWLGFPDIAYFKGQFFVVYRKTTHHQSHTSGLWMSVSKDLKNFTHTEIITPESLHRWNCPRLSICDDELVMIVDCVKAKSNQSFGEAENDIDNLNVYILRSKYGINWSEPVLTGIKGIVPDRVRYIAKKPGFGSSRLLTTAHICHKGIFYQKPWVYSDGNGWRVMFDNAINRPSHLMNYEISLQNKFDCEGSICYDGEKYICLMRNNSQAHYPADIAFSDNCILWDDPKQTRLFGCHRPTFGILKSGNYLVTYREQMSKHNKQFWARNTFACLVPKRSVYSDNPFDEMNILPLDHDNGVKPDGGYTGWVQVGDDIIVVNYITGNNLTPYIKWYQINEDDFGRIV